jgi:cobyrinic acid a,c-diamide synthase
MKGFLIAGTASGVGKTTVSLAILAAMRSRGLVAQAFKGGPDFLDTGHHSRISGRIARNVDTWMLSADANRDVVVQAAQDADVILVEGMMGLFDGKSGDSEAGSSAEIAKLLKLPVVLVLDAGKSARSLAAVVLGFEMFDTQLPLAGVILNRVAGERHYRMLETAIRSACKTPLLGWMPREPAISIPERHLGLHTAEEVGGTQGQDEATATQIEALGSLAGKHLDLERLMSLECGLDITPLSSQVASEDTATIRIGVARDRAFSFYYEDNLDLLRQHGALIVPFSPTHDASLPADLDLLYLGGGYAELYAKQLSSNGSMLASIRTFVASGRPVYAECGGMMYLSQRLTTLDGVTHTMAGILPFAMEMTGALVQFGYVTAELTQDCLLGLSGTIIRGHSFHHSRIIGDVFPATNYRVEYSLSGKQESEGYSVGNVLASYIHLHFLAAPSIALHLIKAARVQQATRVPA